MSDWSYSDEELDAYFNDPDARRKRPKRGVRGWFHNRIAHPKMAEAAFVVSLFAGAGLLMVLALVIYMLMLSTNLPSIEQLENPELDLATIAYTADGEEIARYATQNRSWTFYNEISPNVINALVATEDHQFYDHWGMNVRRTFTAVTKTVLGKLGFGYMTQGGSTITQQLARNLYNEIGMERSVERKLKEMITAVQLEKRYTKQEIIEMYLNTVSFGPRAFGIEAGAHRFFNTSPAELEPTQAAVLVGMLQANTAHNPILNPDRSKRRRNQVLFQMVRRDYLDRSYYDENKDLDIVVDPQSTSSASSIAPHFAEYVKQVGEQLADDLGFDFYGDGLRIYTTLDAEMQKLAKQAVIRNMDDLQTVVDYQWSRDNPARNRSTSVDWYKERTDYEPFSTYWRTRTTSVNDMIDETARYQSVRREGLTKQAAIERLRGNEAFMDSLRTVKTRLEAGFVAVDPQTGYVKAWVGGRNLTDGWYDHVAQAKRQPGSTFKPFVYTAAIANGYSPMTMYPDSVTTFYDAVGTEWRPRNSGESTGQLMSIRDGLAQSKNTITAHLISEVGPKESAFYARRMGIQSPLQEVLSLGLGTSDVTLLELAAAYGTIANRGLYNPPVSITRIEDRFGNVLYENTAAPTEALSEETA
ncbi:MAG: transglycosylase domain-containing protein, partial [Bacteroidota bacterium]